MQAKHSVEKVELYNIHCEQVVFSLDMKEHQKLVSFIGTKIIKKGKNYLEY